MDAEPTEVYPDQVYPDQIYPGHMSSAESPSITNEAQSDFYSLDPRNQRLNQITGLIFSVILMVAMTIGLGVLWFNVGLGPVLIGASVGGMLLIGCSLGAAFLWPSLAFRHASWRLDTEGLEIRRGVLWRHQITIPLGRVQHADVSQGPLQRFFDIGTLTVHTAGTQNASVELDGLTHSIAIEIRDQLVRQRRDQNVV